MAEAKVIYFASRQSPERYLLRAFGRAAEAPRDDPGTYDGHLRRCHWWIGLINCMKLVGSREGHLGGGSQRP